MKKLLWIAIVCCAGLLGMYLVRKHYMADLVAGAITAETLPDYLPKKLKKKIKDAREPIHASAEEVLKEIHKADIPLHQILEMIDNTTEEQVDLILEEASEINPKSPNAFFDIVKKHVKPEFDLEILRTPFNENMDMKTLQRAIQYTKANRKTNDMDLETAKEIAKKVLIEKEKELRSKKTE